MSSMLEQISDAAKACDVCAPHLKDGVRPVFQVSQSAKILIAGQAPGRKVHETGVPFDDASGDRLREWMGINRTTFYNAEKIAILPMGFCYPGTGRSGDLPPRPECAPKWRQSFLDLMPQIELTLIIGKYAMDWHLKGQSHKNLTETVRHWQDYAPGILPLPHPSPRNNIWLKKNEWFVEDVIPHLKTRVSALI